MDKKASKEVILSVVSFIAVFAIVIFLVPGMKEIAITGKSSGLLDNNAGNLKEIPAMQTSAPNAEENTSVQDNGQTQQEKISPANNIYVASGGGHSSGGSKSSQPAEEENNAVSNIIDSFVNGNSFVSADSYVLGSTILDSNIISSIIKYSLVDPSNVTTNSTVLYSNITDSMITNSFVNISTIIDSTILNSNIINCTIVNSTLSDMQLSNAIMINNVLVSSYFNITNSIIGYWKMDNQAGNEPDSSPNNLIMSQVGIVNNQPGKINTSRGKYTDSNYFKNVDVYRNGKNLTVNLWLYQNNTAPDNDAFFSLGGPSDLMVELVDVDNQFAFYVAPGDGVSELCDVRYGSIPSKSWQMMTATFDGTTCKLYVNGVYVNSGTTNGIVYSYNQLYIGNVYGAENQGADGYFVDEVGLWNRTFDDSEISDLWNGSSGVSYPETHSTIGNDAIVYEDNVSGNKEIYITDINGSNPARLTNNLADDRAPKFSPDGTKILFVSTRDNANGELYIMNRDGTNVQRITNSAAMSLDNINIWITKNYWSPDGQKIAFTAGAAGASQPDSYIINSDSTGLSSVINSGDDEYISGWSVNNKLAFWRNAPFNGYTGEVWTANADGTNQAQLTNNPSSDNAHMPIWSPDGTKILYAFHNATQDQYDIYVMNSDGTNKTALTNTPSYKELPQAWASNGKIYYISNQNGFWELWSMNTDGAEATKITSRNSQTTYSADAYADVYVNQSANCTDSDNDGICDSEDNVIGNVSDVNTTIPDLNITINGTSNLSQVFSGTLKVEFKQAMKTIASFDFNFTGNVLNLSNIHIGKQLASATKGYIYISGVSQASNTTKTLYMDNIDTNLNWVCIKDAELNDISEITPNCKGANEYNINCNGVERYGYKCENNGTGYVINGLKHSGAMQFNSSYAGHYIQFNLEGTVPDSYNITIGPYVLPTHTDQFDNCSETNCEKIFMDNRIFSFNITNGTALLGTMTLNGVLVATTAADKVTFTGTSFMWGDATITSLDSSFPYSGNYKVVMEAWNKVGALAIINQTGAGINTTQFAVNMTRILSNNEIIIKNANQMLIDNVSNSRQYNLSIANFGGLQVNNAYETLVSAMTAPYLGIYNRTTTIGIFELSNSTNYFIIDGWGKGWYNQNQSKYYRLVYGYVVYQGNVSNAPNISSCASDLECNDSDDNTLDKCSPSADFAFFNMTVLECSNRIYNIYGHVTDTQTGLPVAGANISFYPSSVFTPYVISNWTNYFENGVIDNSTGDYSALQPKAVPDTMTDANGNYKYYLPPGTSYNTVIQHSSKKNFDSSPQNVTGGRLMLPEDGNVVVTFEKASAYLKSDLYFKNVSGANNSVLISAQSTVGVFKDIGNFNIGDELQFFIRVNGTPMGLPPAYEHNSTSKYAILERLDYDTWRIYFEDLPDNKADWDFNDAVVLVDLTYASNTSNYTYENDCDNDSIKNWDDENDSWCDIGNTDTDILENDTGWNVEGHIIHSGQYVNDNNYTCAQDVEFVFFGQNKGAQGVTVSFAVENHSQTGQPTHMRLVCQNQTGLVYGEDKVVYCGDKNNESENLFIPAGVQGNDKVEKHYTFRVPCEFAPEEGEKAKYDIHVYDNLQWGNMHKIGNFFVMGFNRSLLNQTNATTNQTNTTAPNNPPVVQITNPNNGANFIQGVLINFTGIGYDPEDGTLFGSSLKWYDGGTYFGQGSFISLNNLSLGAHNIMLTATDSQNASANASATITINPNLPPVVTITYPQNLQVFDHQQINFTGTAVDDLDGVLTGNSLVWSSDADGNYGNGTFVIANLSDGTHLITLTATDSLGATGSANITITVNLTIPVNVTYYVNITAPANGTVFNQTDDITFTGIAGDSLGNNFSSLNWSSSIDGNFGNGNSVIKNLSVGNHTITLVGYNSSGNAVGEDSVQITVIDNKPPMQITNLTPIAITNHSILWTWNNPPDSDFSFVIILFNGTWASNQSSESYLADYLQSNTTYHIQVTAVDSSGNVNPSWVYSNATTLPNNETASPPATNTIPGLGEIQIAMQDPPMLFTNLTLGNFTNPTELKYGVAMAPPPGSVEYALYRTYLYIQCLECYPPQKPDPNFNVTIIAKKVNSTENYILLTNGQGVKYRYYPPQYAITPYNYSTPEGYYDIILTAVYIPTGQTATATKRIKVVINEEEANSIAEPIYRDYFGGWLPYDIGDPWRNVSTILYGVNPIWDRYDDMNNHMGDEYCAPGDCLADSDTNNLDWHTSVCLGLPYVKGVPPSTGNEYNQTIDNFLHYLKCNCGETILTGGRTCT